MDVGELHHHHFADRVSQVFRLLIGGGALELTLIEARKLDEPPPDGHRAPFSLLFRGPAEPVLPQAIYPLVHEELGELSLFVVPLGPQRDGALFEVVVT